MARPRHALSVRVVLRARRTSSHWRSTLNAMMTRIGVRLVLLIAIGATIGCDRVTKHVAATTLSEGPSRSFLADTFRLEYVENTGAFLGFGADWPLAVRTAVFGVGNGLLLLALAVTSHALALAQTGSPRSGSVRSWWRLQSPGSDHSWNGDRFHERWDWLPAHWNFQCRRYGHHARRRHPRARRLPIR